MKVGEDMWSSARPSSHVYSLLDFSGSPLSAMRLVELDSTHVSLRDLPADIMQFRWARKTNRAYGMAMKLFTLDLEALHLVNP